MRQLGVRRAVLFLFFAMALLIACNSNVAPEQPAPRQAEHVGTVGLALGALPDGDACDSNAQCLSGHCVDAVCCNTECGGGARDNQSCSNVYGVVPGLIPGTCKTDLQDNDPCGVLVGLNPCTWRGTLINGGGNCPAPNDGLTHACYTCGPMFGDATCPPGLPICDPATGGCGPCGGNFGSGATGACPTDSFPVCKDGGCVQCDATHTANCTGNTGSCNLTTNQCVGCNGDSGKTPIPSPDFRCSTATPVCLTSGPNAGACKQCIDDPARPSACAGATPFCDPATNTCVNCNTSADCPSSAPVCTGNVCSACTADRVTGASPECPTAPLPACVGGVCKQCSAGNTTVCGATKICDTASNLCVQCNAADSHLCTGATPFCNLLTSTCSSSCMSDAQCGGATPKCSASGSCVACITTGSAIDPVCPAATPFCTNEKCVECKTAAQCGGTKPVCSSAGACVACNGDNGSAASQACPTTLAPACKLATGACVQCTASDRVLCTAPNLVCNTTTDKCVECTAANSSACVGAKPICNTATGVCVACNGDRNSGASAACTLAADPACLAGPCVECSASNVTACPAGLPVCNTTTHLCVQCLSNAQCTGANGICNTGSNTCTAGCASDANCGGLTPKCNLATSRCVECIADGNCAAPTPSCNLTTNNCVECLTDAACGGSKPICSAGACVACDGDRGSGTPQACKSTTAPACVTAGAGAGSCVECTAGDPVLCVGAKPACNEGSHTCVQCGSNAQCSGTTPICNPAGTCIACDGDQGEATPAACATVTTPACLKAGAKSGTCAQCSGTNATACKGGTPVCDVVANLCVQCVDNTQCTGPNGVCDTSKHVCTLGCTTDANCTSAAPACKIPGMFCVQCTATNKTACKGTTPVCDVAVNTCVGCLTGADCPAATPVCDPKTKSCVATCTASSECPGSAPVCDPVTKVCEECVESKDCKDPLKPICNSMTHTCGTDCTKSAECPGATPVCDPVTKKCEECVDPKDCKDPTKPVCNGQTHMCSGDCAKSSECPGSTPVCDPKTMKCVGCVDDKDCPTTAPHCDGTSRMCIVPDDLSIEGGGCACSTVPNDHATTIPVLLGLGLAVTAFARRRRPAIDRR